ncbi:glycoside hydrolase family 6 protein [Candidatus Kaiserbacteria bacterium]|nr:glycoside hydrolase family 6 protein [Candidatus Kaiserbacteria bacterium]
MTFWVNPHSSAASQAAAWSSSDPTDAALMRMLAAQPTAQWFGGWNSNIQNDVHATVASAQSAGAVPVLVAYNIPFRDCGGYSAGGATSYAAYTSWIQSFAAGIGSAKAVVILEPDALATISCLSSSDAQTRLTLLTNAVTTLKTNSNTKVYIDAGHTGWIDHAQMANELRSANVAHADGFALNVSNFGWTSDNTAYGTQISNDLGGAHFVIDTSRNGLGSTPDNQWCNPAGRGIGTHPTTATGNSLIDALLWLKVPGESDGNCNGGPNAGTWWSSYAVGLAQRGVQ